jgi:hypothetical protein
LAEILCLDCDDAFMAALSSAGHRVQNNRLGYGRRGRVMTHPPHEVDAIVSNITTPLCRDLRANRFGDWSLRDAVVPPRDDRAQLQEPVSPRAVAPGVPARSAYELVNEGLLASSFVRQPFSQHDVLKAVERAGVPTLFFLNDLWLRHASNFPNAIGLTWEVQATVAYRVQCVGELSRIFPEYGSSLSFEMPLRRKLTRGPLVCPVPHWSEQLSSGHRVLPRRVRRVSGPSPDPTFFRVIADSN